MKSSTVRRLFIAIDVSEELTLHFDEVLNRFRDDGSPKIRWVKPTNIHLTVKFLGDTAENMIQHIDSSMSAITAECSPFSVHVHGLGAFPNLRAPRTLWWGVRGNMQPLVAMKNELESILESKGFPRDRNTFAPHLTLGRIKRHLTSDEQQRFKQSVANVGELASLNLIISKISLIESRLNQHREKYVHVHEYSLKMGEK